MKYFNGLLWINNKQTDTFICAKTKKRAMELAYGVDHTSKNYFCNYWSDCGNDEMKKTAKDTEGIWIEEKRYSNKYKKYK